MSHFEDSDLIARVLADDDRHAFAELVRRHQSSLRAFLRQLTRGDRALADDLAQETLLEAYRSLGRFRGASAFSSWLLGIAYNRFRQYGRKRREEPMADLPEATEEALAEAAVAEQTSDLGVDLPRALAELRPEERTALQLCYSEGLSHEQAASLMECPLGTLKTHVLRAKQRLRAFLGDYAKAT